MIPDRSLLMLVVLDRTSDCVDDGDCAMDVCDLG